MLKNDIENDFVVFFIKIIFPAFLAVGIKIAIEMKSSRSTLTALNVALSMLTGVGSAYLSSGIVQKNCSEELIPVAIALIAILSEKIGEFLIFKLNLDIFLTALADAFFGYIKKILNIQK